MKRLFFIVLASLYIIKSYPAASSSEGLISHNTLSEAISSLYDNIIEKLSQVYGFDKDTFENNNPSTDSAEEEPDRQFFGDPKNPASEVRLRSELSKAYEESWTSAALPLQLQALKEDIKGTLIHFFIERELRDLMTVCDCVEPADRISFIIVVAHQIMQKFPKPDSKIVITSFASGLLLQEYLLLRLLSSHGYNNITANFIDTGFPDPISLRRVLNSLDEKNQKKSLKHYKHEILRLSGIDSDGDSKNRLSQLKWVEENKDAFPEFVELYGSNYFSSQMTYNKALELLKSYLPSIKIQTYNSMHEYIQIVEKYPEMKSDVFTMVDPDLTVFEVPAYPSLANLIAIQDKNNFNQEMFITAAKNKPVQLYLINHKENTDSQIPDLTSMILAKIKETNSNKLLSSEFKNWLINLLSQDNTDHLEKILLRWLQFLQQGIYDQTDDIEKMLDELQFVSEELNDQFGSTDQNVPTLSIPPTGVDYLQVIDFIDAAFDFLNNISHSYRFNNLKIVQHSDPHMAFQELVEKTAKTDALIYVYYKYPPINEDSQSYDTRFEAFDKTNYLKLDVFGPIVGRMLTTDGHFYVNDEKTPYSRINLLTGSPMMPDELEAQQDMKRKFQVPTFKPVHLAKGQTTSTSDSSTDNNNNLNNWWNSIAEWKKKAAISKAASGDLKFLNQIMTHALKNPSAMAHFLKAISSDDPFALKFKLFYFGSDQEPAAKESGPQPSQPSSRPDSSGAASSSNSSSDARSTDTGWWQTVPEWKKKAAISKASNGDVGLLNQLMAAAQKNPDSMASFNKAIDGGDLLAFKINKLLAK